MYWVYILKSLKDNGYYTGSTGKLDDRIKRHMQGRSKATKSRRPLRLIFKKSFAIKNEALKLERKIKQHKSKKYIEKIIRDKMGR